MSKSHARLSGFGDTETNDRLYQESLLRAKPAEKKKTPPVTSMKDPRFISLREQLEQEAAKKSRS